MNIKLDKVFFNIFFGFRILKNKKNMSAIQIIKIDDGILKYFEMVMNFQNESEEYKKITIAEFKEELQKSLNCGVAKKEIQWTEKT